MVNLYIDESGSITSIYSNEQPYFVIGIVRVKEPKKLKTAIKRFVSSNLSELKACDTDHKMFDCNGKFLELKGSCFSYSLKKKFLEYFSRYPYFDVFYIQLMNSKADPTFCKNKARCFNYLLKTAFIWFAHQKYLNNEEYFLHIDERNIRTESKYVLTDYLNTELLFGKIIDKLITVEYKDSRELQFIQFADVFSNIYYSNLLTHNYNKEINALKKTGMIKPIFKFPIN